MAIEIGFFIGAVLLGIAIAYGIMQNRRRNTANDPITDRATRESYRDTDAYARGKDESLRKEVRPS